MRKKGRFETPRTAPRTDAQKQAEAQRAAARKAQTKPAGPVDPVEPIEPIDLAPETTEQVPQKKKMPVGAIIGISAAALVLAAVVGVWVYGSSLIKKDTVFPNVFIAGVDVSGLKQDAAVAAVEGAVNKTYAAETLTVVLPDRELVLDPEITNVALDPEQAVEAAMAHGRQGGPIQAILTWHTASEPYHVDLDSSMNLDTDYIRQQIERTAADAAKELEKATATVDEEAGTITVITGKPAMSLDVDALYEEVLDRFETGDYSDLHFDYSATGSDSVDLEIYYEKFAKDAKDAYYDEEAKELVPEEIGYGFDLPYYTQKVAMAEAGSTVVIQMEEIQPEVTLEQLEEVYFSATLAKRDTWHTNNAPRTKNLELACKAIDGFVLNPGEIFSFNKVVGERTADKGYQAATVYLDGGRSEAETGGGICQVASNIYEACLYADLKIVERQPHMFEVTYVGPGQDATIYWGQLDYKFENSTNYPIRINASVSGGYVHIELVGTAEEKDYHHVNMRGTTIRTDDWTTVGVLDEKNKNEKPFEITFTGESFQAADGKTYKLAEDESGKLYKTTGKVIETPYTGKAITVYRDFVDENNKVLRTETIGTSTYVKRDEKYLVSEFDPKVDDPNYDPRLDPESPDYVPEMDPNNPNYIPGYDPDNPGFTDPSDPWGGNDPANPWDDGIGNGSGSGTGDGAGTGNGDSWFWDTDPWG